MNPVSNTENFFSNDSKFVEDIQKPPNLEIKDYPKEWTDLFYITYNYKLISKEANISDIIPFGPSMN